MRILKTYEGYKKIMESENFMIFYNELNKEFDLIPFQEEFIIDFFKKNNIPEKIINIFKINFSIKNIKFSPKTQRGKDIFERTNLKEEFQKIGIFFMEVDSNELKNITAPMYLISTPSGELVNILISSVPEFINKGLISYDINTRKYICSDKNSEYLKHYVFF